jgi:hypothetical protein
VDTSSLDVLSQNEAGLLVWLQGLSQTVHRLALREMLDAFWRGSCVLRLNWLVFNSRLEAQTPHL